MAQMETRGEMGKTAKLLKQGTEVRETTRRSTDMGTHAEECLPVDVSSEGAVLDLHGRAKHGMGNTGLGIEREAGKAVSTCL